MGRPRRNGELVSIDDARGLHPVPPGRYVDYHMMEMRTLTATGIVTITMVAFARKIGISNSALSQIRAGRDRLNPRLCLALENVTGIKAETWAETQWLWDLYLERERQRKAE